MVRDVAWIAKVSSRAFARNISASGIGFHATVLWPLFALGAFAQTVSREQWVVARSNAFAVHAPHGTPRAFMRQTAIFLAVFVSMLIFGGFVAVLSLLAGFGEMTILLAPLAIVLLVVVWLALVMKQVRRLRGPREVRRDILKMKRELGPGWTASGLVSDETQFGQATVLAERALGSLPPDSLFFAVAASPDHAKLYKRNGMVHWGSTGLVMYGRTPVSS